MVNISTNQHMRVISKLKDVESNLSGHKDKLNGKLTVTTVVSFGTTWLNT